MTDLALVGGNVVDGSGGDPGPGTVLVDGDRVEAVIGPDAAFPGDARVVSVAGRVVTPGFVDVHSHSDLTPFVEPTMDSMLRQGVTTLVVGNCGASAFPSANPAEMAALVGVDADAIDVTWRTFGGYLDSVDAARPALNVAALVGHGTLRQAALLEQRRPPSDAELGEMRRLLGQGLDEGAVGMSTGLVYAPGLHASTDEIVALAGELTTRGGIATSHVRGEAETVFDAVRECIEVGRRAGVPAHVSHLKVETQPMWGRARELLAMIDRERARGADVSADQYPYTAWETELASALPPWVTPEELEGVLADPAGRERLLAAIDRGVEPGWQSVGRGIGWDRIVLGSHGPEPSLTGRSVASVAEERGVEAARAIADLLVADRFTGIVGHAMDEGDVREILARPDVFVATDGVATSPDGPLGAVAIHPRSYGTFPRVLGHYARDERVLPVGTAVAKMTSGPADRFSLAGRGRVVPGAVADLVVFDPGRIADAATFERPHAFADGIELVLVNGRMAWDGERVVRAGRALRRGAR